MIAVIATKIKISASASITRLCLSDRLVGSLSWLIQLAGRLDDCIGQTRHAVESQSACSNLNAPALASWSVPCWRCRCCFNAANTTGLSATEVTFAIRMDQPMANRLRHRDVKAAAGRQVRVHGKDQPPRNAATNMQNYKP
jgi:hypothetical protein